MAAKNRRLLLDDGPVWRITEEDIPEVPADGVIVKVLHAGICHTDVHMSEKDFIPGYDYPRVLGHEVSGIVHKVGVDLLEDQPDFEIGDRVIVYPWGFCGECPTCLQDLSFCSDRSPRVCYEYGIWQDGGYQQYMVVHKADFIIKVPDDVPLDIASLVPCSGITALNASLSLGESLKRAINVKGSASVGLVGTGGLALWTIPILKALYPQNLSIVAIDIVDEKLTDAKAQGAEETLNWAINEPTLTVDGIIDFTGIPDCQMRAYDILNAGGTLAMVGLSSKGAPPFPITMMIAKCITIKGIMAGTRSHCREVLQLLKDKKIKPPPITGVTLADVEPMIIQMRQNKIRGRCVVKF